MNFSFVISNDVFGFITILFDIIKISDEGFPFDLDLVYGVCLFVNKWFGFHLHFSALRPIVLFWGWQCWVEASFNLSIISEYSF